MFISINKKTLKFPLDSSETSILEQVKNNLAWPKNRAFLNWDGLKVEIQDENELHFAVKMIAEELFHEFNRLRGDFDEIEKKLLSEKIDDCSDDGELKSEDDMTQEDFYMMGYRHEIT
jgi:hypothetical protein